jgi:hypothetical protein
MTILEEPTREERLAIVRQYGDEPHAFVAGSKMTHGWGSVGALAVGREPLCVICDGREAYIAHETDLLGAPTSEKGTKP